MLASSIFAFFTGCGYARLPLDGYGYAPIGIDNHSPGSFARGKNEITEVAEMVNMLTGSSIPDTIRRVAPKKVAVAYLGINWQRILPDLSAITSIIISPNLGTNPVAVEALVAAFKVLGHDTNTGWESVYFSNDLHAKLYLGENSAVMGSANLSLNGMGEGLRELCALVTNQEDIEFLRTYFDNCEAAARREYATDADKITRLERLKEETRRNPAVERKFADEARSSDKSTGVFTKASDFAITWAYGSADYTPEMETKITNLRGDTSTHPFLGECSFGRSDIPFLETSPWILVWHMNRNGKPSKKYPPYWFKVEDFYTNGIEDADFPVLAVTRSKLFLENAPFPLDKAKIDALYQVLRTSDTLRQQLSDGGVTGIFSVAETVQYADELVQQMNAAIQNGN